MRNTNIKGQEEEERLKKCQIMSKQRGRERSKGEVFMEVRGREYFKNTRLCPK